MFWGCVNDLDQSCAFADPTNLFSLRLVHIKCFQTFSQVKPDNLLHC